MKSRTAYKLLRWVEEIDEVIFLPNSPWYFKFSYQGLFALLKYCWFVFLANYTKQSDNSSQLAQADEKSLQASFSAKYGRQGPTHFRQYIKTVESENRIKSPVLGILIWTGIVTPKTQKVPTKLTSQISTLLCYLMMLLSLFYMFVFAIMYILPDQIPTGGTLLILLSELVCILTLLIFYVFGPYTKRLIKKHYLYLAFILNRKKI